MVIYLVYDLIKNDTRYETRFKAAINYRMNGLAHYNYERIRMAFQALLSSHEFLEGVEEQEDPDLVFEPGICFFRDILPGKSAALTSKPRKL